MRFKNPKSIRKHPFFEIDEQIFFILVILEGKMESLNLTLLIDWALRIMQIITFIGVILKISFNKNGYSDNVIMKRIKFEDLDSLNKDFSFIQSFEDIQDSTYNEYFVLYPKNVDIISLKFIEINYGKNAKEIEEIRDTKKM